MSGTSIRQYDAAPLCPLSSHHRSVPQAGHKYLPDLGLLQKNLVGYVFSLILLFYYLSYSLVQFVKKTLENNTKLKVPFHFVLCIWQAYHCDCLQENS